MPACPRLSAKIDNMLVSLMRIAPIWTQLQVHLDVNLRHTPFGQIPPVLAQNPGDGIFGGSGLHPQFGGVHAAALPFIASNTTRRCASTFAASCFSISI